MVVPVADGNQELQLVERANDKFRTSIWGLPLRSALGATVGRIPIERRAVELSSSSGYNEEPRLPHAREIALHRTSGGTK